MKKKIYVTCAVITVICIAIIAYCMGKSAGSKAQAPAEAPATAPQETEQPSAKE